MQAPPALLLIQLKRFDYSTGTGIKIEDKITCPLQGLQILQEALPTGSTSPNYDLQAFVHQSGSLGGGHYIAYVYRTRNGEAAWWCYNDTSVTKKTKEEVKNAAKTGYVYAYKQR